MTPVAESPPKPGETSEPLKAGPTGAVPDTQEPKGDQEPPEPTSPDGEGGDFPGEGKPQEDPPAIPDLEVEGLKQLSMSVGGARAEESQAKLRGGSIAVTGGGQFDKGALVDLTVRCRVTEVHFVDHVDKQSGETTAVIRRHILKPERVERV